MFTIDTSSRSAIHTSQLRQPGDYLKNNRMAPPCIHTFTMEPNENRKQTLNGQSSPSYKREQLETATKKAKTRHKKKKKETHTSHEQQRTDKNTSKGMSTENNIGVQTRAMAQRVDNEANPEQVQKTTDQATTPTVELHRTKEDTIKEFI